MVAAVSPVGNPAGKASLQPLPGSDRSSNALLIQYSRRYVKRIVVKS